MQKVIAKIGINALLENAALFKRSTNAKLCAVVKADGYGHGAEEVTLALSQIADCFAVAILEEGLSIRVAATGKDILVFTPPVTEEECYLLAANGLIATIPDLFTAKLFASTCEKYRLQGRAHLKGNTGMNRYGMNPSTLGKVCRFLQNNGQVRVEGLYSHLYECKRSTALRQRELFLQMQRICRRYFSSFISHLGATYGALLGEDFAFDMVRVGVGLYGYAPVKTELPLRPVMQVETKVVANRKYAFGGIGYGKESEEKKGTPLAVLRAGYADGFLRKRENGLDGFEKNANDLCMDVCIRKSGKRRGGTEILLTDADKVATQTGTISYEVLCAVGRRAERIYE